MQPGQTYDQTSAEDREQMAMRQQIMGTFCHLLHTTQLPPMTVLAYAAAAIGSVYREVADAHAWPQECPCGWEADELADIAQLQSALALEALTDERKTLMQAPVAGHG